MQIHVPTARPKQNDEFTVYLNQPGQFAVISLSDDGLTRIYLESPEDCDRLIRAACDAKNLLRDAAHGTPTPLPDGTNLLPPGYQIPGTSYTDGAR